MKEKNTEVFSIPPEVASIARTLENKGFEAYLVGGCVRDLLLGKKPRDWDITTNAAPEKIQEMFKESFYENEFGTVGVVTGNTDDETLKVVEVTPYRREGAYSDKRRPDSVVFGGKLEEDLKRRDFTINAIALRLGKEARAGEYATDIVDLYEGQADLQRKIVRTVGNPEERFAEDALRLIRAVRIAVEIGFEIDAETRRAIKKSSLDLRHIAMERIRDEFVRILMSDSPKKGLEILTELGILPLLLPELLEGKGIAQNQAHAFDVWEHTLRTLAHAAKKGFSLPVRLAALFHDIGKPATRRWSQEKSDWTFYGHDVVGARITAKALARLKLPTETAEEVTKLVRWHMFFSDTEKITLSAVRRIVSRVGRERIWELMNLRAADRIGTGRPKESPYRLRKYHAMIDEVLHDPLSVGMLAMKGGRVMEVAGLAPGKKIGWILHALLEEVLDDPGRNNAEYLEKRARELAALPEKELQALGEKGREIKTREEEKKIQDIRKKHWVS